MKKISLFAVVFALLFGFSQCTKKPLLPYPYYATDGKTIIQEITVTASFPPDDSKVDAYETGTSALGLRWKEGDEITVAVGGSGTIKLTSVIDDGKTGIFKGTITANMTPVTFTYGNYGITNFYFDQAGSLDYLESNVCLTGGSEYQPSGYYHVEMELPYAVLKLDLSAFEGDVSIAEGYNQVASVKDVTSSSKELYVLVRETSDGVATAEYTFGDGTMRKATKRWKLNKNHYYTERGSNNGKAIVVAPPQYVDLGLPSGTLWATSNIGANNPEDYGDYFSWGETTTKDSYTWSTYSWCNGYINALTKYCNNSSYGYNGFVDNKTVLDISDDAAYGNWGGDWRIPTKDEMVELKDKCTWTWTMQYGMNGYSVTGSNGNSIFLPAAGYYDNSTINSLGSCGFYWLNSLNDPTNANSLYFNSSGIMVDDTGYRCEGRSVRPVR